MHQLCLAAALLAAAPAAFALENGQPVTDRGGANVAGRSADPMPIAAIRARNGTDAGLTRPQIGAMDRARRAEVGAGAMPTIGPVPGNAMSGFLRGHVQAAGGTITEVFVMDNRGLLAGTSAVTSDYWQGDEARWQDTFGKGAGAIVASDVEFDESTQVYQGQVSMTIADPATGEALGAMTVGLGAEAL